MDIISVLYVVFVLLFAIIYYIVPKKIQWIVLLVASLFFYISTSALLTLLMLATTAITYIGALIIQRNKELYNITRRETPKEERKNLKSTFNKKQKTTLTIIVLLIISGLVFTKYSNFLGGILNAVCSIFNAPSIFPTFNIVLPLGISYYTLMTISYVVDVHRGSINAERNPFKLLLFVTYFPHIVEGPFDRYKSLSEQFERPHKFNYSNAISSIELIIYGYFKKVFVADTVGTLVNIVYENILDESGTVVVMVALLYTVQLYMDFSGCINIVSGVSELFDIKIADNFRQPFFSKSIDEFWRRWHISLGLWLKEYVFYPISLSESFKRINKWSKNTNIKFVADFIPLAYSLFFVWLFNGLWHGASVKYIAYGLYYYALMMLGKTFEPLFNKGCCRLKIRRDTKIFGAFQIFRTFVIVNIGMLLFKCETLNVFGILMSKVLTSVNISDIISVLLISRKALISLAAALVVLFVDLLKEKNIDIRMWLQNHCFVFRWIALLFLIFALLLFGNYGIDSGKAAALYAQF